MRMVFPAAAEALQEASAFIEKKLEEMGCSMKEQMRILVAFEEVFVNVVNYAYEDENGDVTLDLDFEGDDMVMVISDKGKPFDPLSKPDPDITLSVEDRPIGGLGIFMVKKSMDDVSYEYKDGCNVLNIRHKIK